ncbi:MAG: hypothetical protein AAGE18_09610 [Pseudomonadota bacterium]
MRSLPLLALVLVGCAPQDALRPGDGVLEVYRAAQLFSPNVAITVLIDERPAATLDGGTFARCSLPPGQHQVRAEPTVSTAVFGLTTAEVVAGPGARIRLAPGEVLVRRLAVRPGGVGVATTTSGVAVRYSAAIDTGEDRDPETAGIDRETATRQVPCLL